MSLNDIFPNVMNLGVAFLYDHTSPYRYFQNTHLLDHIQKEVSVLSGSRGPTQAGPVVLPIHPSGFPLLLLLPSLQLPQRRAASSLGAWDSPTQVSLRLL